MNKRKNNSAITAEELRLFEAVPGNNLLIIADSPRFSMIAASESYLQMIGKSKAELIGKGVFEAFPSNPESPQDYINLMASFEEVIATKINSHLPVLQYDVMDDENNFITRFWSITNSPVADNEGNVVYIINSVEDITHQIIAGKQQEKIRSLQKAHNLLLQAPMSIQIFKGPDLIIELANDLTLKMWDRDESAVGRPFLEVLPELKGEGYEGLMQEVMETGIAKSFYEVPIYLNKDSKKELGYYTFFYQPYYEDDKRQATGVLVFSTEVTEQVITREKMKESDLKLRSVIENSASPIAVLLGEEMRVEIANPTILEMWGKGDVTGKNYLDVLPETAEQGIFDQLNSVYKTGIPFHVKQQQVNLVHEGKEKTFYFNYSFIPLFDENKQVYGVINTGSDVTDLVLAHQLMEESSRNLQNMIMQSPVAMCILKKPTHIVEIVNDKQLEFWGKERENVLHKPVLEALPETKIQGFKEKLDKIYTTGEKYTASELHISLIRKGQIEQVYVNIEMRPYRESDGTISGIMLVANEITDLVLARHEIEEVVAKRTRQLAEVNYTLQQNNKELEQFAYVAAHDLQEPLRTITNFVGLFVKKYGNPDPDTETYTRFILNATRRMQNLIKDLLDYSTIKTDVPFVKVDLNEVLEQAIDEMSSSIKATNASIISTEMPIINGNAIELKRVFQHLISNAIKFHKEDRIPEIKIKAFEKEKEYHISVEDKGIGIEKEYINKLFVIFQQLHRGQKYSGTGIGLAICKKIVDLHGGSICVESEVGEGTSFHFTIPKS